MSKSQRKKKALNLRKQGWTAQKIAEHLECTPSTIYQYFSEAGITSGAEKGDIDKATELRRQRLPKKLQKIKDRRRFKIGSVPMGETNKVVPKEAVGTMFPGMVKQPDEGTHVLKDGAMNSKIGGDVLVGWLKGAHIVTLTLEERKTCPSSCELWQTCYGNSMNKSTRWKHGIDLECQIIAEVGDLCERHDKVLVRLHILGDFYSVEYLQMWADLLDEYDNLYIFGFTAHMPGTKIGDGVAWLRGQAPRRFSVRTSCKTGTWGSFTLPFPTDAKNIGDAVVCPEQLDMMEGGPKERHCGNCGVCWSTDRPIAFILH